MATSPRHLDFDAVEQPVALQLGGSEPADLAACARLGAALGLRRDQPQLRLPERARAARRVRRLPDGRAGAGRRLRARAMRDAVALPVTVKHRIGIDRVESYDFVRDFVGTVAARRLRGVHRPCPQRLAARHQPEGKPRAAAAALRASSGRCKRDFPALDVRPQRRHRATTKRSPRTWRTFDGVMVGRAAYHHPWCWPTGIAASSPSRPPIDAHATRSRRRWSSTWSGSSSRASRGRMRRATCSACATASRGRAAGARCGPMPRLKGERPSAVSRLARQALGRRSHARRAAPARPPARRRRAPARTRRLARS